MSSSITILHGNLGKDPEIFRTDSDFPIATFSLATTRRVSDGNNGKKEVTDWHNVKALGKNAELAEKYLHKGKEMIVFGHNETRDYEDKETGKKCYITEIVVDRFDFCGSADNQQNGGQQSNGSNRSQSSDRQQNGGNRSQSNGYSQNQSNGRQQGSNARSQGGGYNQNRGGYQQQHGDDVPYEEPPRR